MGRDGVPAPKPWPIKVEEKEAILHTSSACVTLPLSEYFLSPNKVSESCFLIAINVILLGIEQPTG